MKIISDYKKIERFLEQIHIEKAYPYSMIEGYQSGEVYVNDIDYPTAALFWHYCGFAFPTGDCTKDMKNEIYKMMLNPSEAHRSRFIIQADNDDPFTEATALPRRERYIFSFEKPVHRISISANRARLCAITNENYCHLQGRIVPSFSWRNKAEFLKNGFGYCLRKGHDILACAFSAAVSGDYVDIGVETSETYRGNGYGKIVASAMVEEILRQGKTPMWACDTENEGSMRLACSVGFRIVGSHPWYRL